MGRTVKQKKLRNAKVKAHILAKGHLESLELDDEIQWDFPDERMLVSKELFRIRKRLQKEIDRKPINKEES